MLKKFNHSDKPMSEPAKTKTKPQFPGVRAAMDGNTAAIMCERESSDAAGAYPITPSTQMGEYWAEAAAAGHLNISNKPVSKKIRYALCCTYTFGGQTAAVVLKNVDSETQLFSQLLTA